jgi:ribosome biogenesis protein BRX1
MIVSESNTPITFIEFISPAAVRSLARREKGGKYNYRKDAEQEQERRKEMRRLGEDELAVSKVFA